MKDCFLTQNVALIPENGEVFGYNSKHDHYTQAKWNFDKNCGK